MHFRPAPRPLQICFYAGQPLLVERDNLGTCLDTARHRSMPTGRLARARPTGGPRDQTKNACGWRGRSSTKEKNIYVKRENENAVSLVFVGMRSAGLVLALAGLASGVTPAPPARTRWLGICPAVDLFLVHIPRDIEGGQVGRCDGKRDQFDGVHLFFAFVCLFFPSPCGGVRGGRRRSLLVYRKL
nr:hypothetical protein [Pandoravirus massiliensis]